MSVPLQSYHRSLLRKPMKNMRRKCKGIYIIWYSFSRPFLRLSFQTLLFLAFTISGRVHALYLARFFPMRAQWDRSLPPPVAETGRRSVGNRKERPGARLCEFPGGRERDGKRPGESCFRAVFSQVQHCTWLGFPSRAVGGKDATLLQSETSVICHSHQE